MPVAPLESLASRSGAGAVSSTNFRDGALLAIEELNAKGGILGRKIDLKQYDTQTNPGTARSQMQKAIDEEPYIVLGPIFSGIVKVSMALTAQAEIPMIMGGEASDLTQQGNAYLFRTSFGQQASMPKIANYIRDTVKAKSTYADLFTLWKDADAKVPMIERARAEYARLQ